MLHMRKPVYLTGARHLLALVILLVFAVAPALAVGTVRYFNIEIYKVTNTQPANMGQRDIAGPVGGNKVYVYVKIERDATVTVNGVELTITPAGTRLPVDVLTLVDDPKFASTTGSGNSTLYTRFYTTVWNAAGLPNGKYQLTAVATCTFEGRPRPIPAISDVVEISVTAPSNAPAPPAK